MSGAPIAREQDPGGAALLLRSKSGLSVAKPGSSCGGRDAAVASGRAGTSPPEGGSGAWDPGVALGVAPARRAPGSAARGERSCVWEAASPLPHHGPARPRPPRSSSAAEASASRGPATPEDWRLHLATHVSCVFRASASPGGREGRALRGWERGRAGHGGGRWAPLRRGFASVTGRERHQGLPGPCSPFRRARTRETAAERGGLGPGCSPGSGAPGRARGCRPAPPRPRPPPPSSLLPPPLRGPRFLSALRGLRLPWRRKRRR